MAPFFWESPHNKPALDFLCVFLHSVLNLNSDFFDLGLPASCPGGKCSLIFLQIELGSSGCDSSKATVEPSASSRIIVHLKVGI